MELDYTPEFKRAVKKLSRQYRSVRTDIDVLIEQLLSGQTPGDPLQNTGYRAFKVRIKNSDNHKGKSGGYRVMYYLKTQDKAVLLTLYSKSYQSDILPDEVRHIIAKYEDRSGG